MNLSLVVVELVLTQMRLFGPPFEQLLSHSGRDPESRFRVALVCVCVPDFFAVSGSVGALFFRSRHQRHLDRAKAKSHDASGHHQTGAERMRLRKSSQNVHSDLRCPNRSFQIAANEWAMFRKPQPLQLV